MKIILQTTDSRPMELNNNNMRPKHLAIISRCIEEGCRYGVSRAHKHTEDPSYEQIEEECHSAIMERLHEVYDFPEVMYEY